MGETHGHYSKKALVVSQTEPTNPSDGLLWYKPDLCLTTTTTTLAPPSCPEGAIYSGWMTVGTDNDAYYGYYVNFGSIDPPLESIREIDWDSFIGTLYFDINEECNNPTVIVDGVEFSGFTWSGEYWTLSGVSENPFAAVDELSSICILCGAETTTTTTPQPQ